MTDTTGPLILSEKKFGRFRLGGGPKPRPGVAVALFSPGGRCVELLPGQQMTPGERFYGGYTAYEVDVTPRSFRLFDELPTKNAAYSFTAEAHVRCKVKSPKLVVEQNLEDAEPELGPLILRTLREVSQRFEANETAAAEAAMQQAVRGQDYGLGIAVDDIVVQLDLDATTAAHARRLDDVRRQQEIEQATSAAQFEQQIADLKRQLELEKARKPVRDESDEQERQRKAAWLEFYAPLVEREQWKLVALQLAADPDSLPQVIAQLDERQQQALAAQMTAVELLLKHDLVDESEVEGPAKQMMQDLINSFRQSMISFPSLSTATEKRSLPSGDEKRPEAEASTQVGKAEEPSREDDEGEED